MKQNVILTINKRSEWPVTSRTPARYNTQNWKVYTFLRDRMSIGDVVSVPVAKHSKAKALQCALTYYRKEEGTTETLGYQTKIISNSEGGVELYIRKVRRVDMRKAGKPYSKTRRPAQPVVPPLPPLPQVVSPVTREAFANQNV